MGLLGLVGPPLLRSKRAAQSSWALERARSWLRAMVIWVELPSPDKVPACTCLYLHSGKGRKNGCTEDGEWLRVRKQSTKRRTGRWVERTDESQGHLIKVGRNALRGCSILFERQARTNSEETKRKHTHMHGRMSTHAQTKNSQFHEFKHVDVARVVQVGNVESGVKVGLGRGARAPRFDAHLGDKRLECGG